MLAKIALGLVVGVIIAYLGWRLFIDQRLNALEAIHGRLVAFETLELTWKPNQFLLAPPGATKAAEPHAPSPVFAVPPGELASELARIIEYQPRSRLLSRSTDGLRMTALQQTALMRFPDFAAVEVRAAPGGSTLLVYSRSVFGVRDFGVNRARVEGWLAALRGKLPEVQGK